jgi:outer membrane protein assembly factor BamB
MNFRASRFPRLVASMLALAPLAAQAEDWYSWRGPTQDGRSAEKYPENVFPDAPDWTFDISGRGAPVIANGRIFLYSYKGQGAEQAEGLTCFDEKTGKLLWEKRLPDFLSDNAYSRYAIGSPTVDVETGLIYLMSTAGELVAMDRDGKTLWQRSLMEEVGRLSFPNGRTGAPVIVGDLVIVRGITANWGGDGPARDRFYAYQKKSGDLVWASTPGVQPQDSSFSTGIIEMRGGVPVLYATTGCGHFVAMNALTGKPLWRFLTAKGGVNASCILVNGKLISAHDKENIDTTMTGGLECIRLPEGALPPGPPEDPVPVLPKTAEAWRLPYSAETSSPVYADGMVFQVATTGVLYAADPETGAQLWEEKLGPGNLHASPLYVNGLLYVPILNDVASEDGLLFVIKPTKEKGEVIKRIKLSGFALGPPSVANGKLYICTAKKLYAFTIAKGAVTGKGDWFTLPKTQPGPVAALQALPQEVILHPGESQAFKIRGIDAKGYPAGEVTDAKWESYIPPTAKVKATLDATFGTDGKLAALPTAKQSAGAFKATSGNATGVIRGRVISALPISQDFESIIPTEDSLTDPGVKFAYPPLPWIGGRFKWEVRELDGNKVLFKTLSPVFFQRATTFIGSDEMKNYTVQADMMTEGNRRMKSEVGLINQRYLITLKGNSNEIEVSSNQERLKVAAPFPVAAKTWYTLKTRVDLSADGSGVIKGKAWAKGSPEPDAWTIEVPHKIAHPQGAPGLFGFALQGKQTVYVDNIQVTPNK